MTPQEKLVARLFLILLIICPIVVAVHYSIFPEETKCILIDFQGLEKKGGIYYSDSTSEASVDHLQTLIDSASARVAKFWGEKRSDPDYIFLERDDEYAGYCKNDEPAVTYFKMGAHIVIGEYGANTDILAHEIAQAELFERIGFFNWTFGIPTWFKQGLSLQVCDQKEYGEDSLAAFSNEAASLDIKNFDTDGSFYYGTKEEIKTHLALAKREVNLWYTPEKLSQFISDINAGKSFYEAYGVAEEMPLPQAPEEESTTTAVEAVEPAPAPVAEETMTLQTVPVTEDIPAAATPEKPVKEKKKTSSEEDAEEPVKEFKTAKPEDFFPKQ